MIDFLNKIKEMVINNGWMIQVFLVVFATLCVNFLENRIYHYLQPRLLKEDSVWRNAFVQAIHKPLVLIIWATGLLMASYVFYLHTDNPALKQIMEHVINLASILAIFWFVLLFIKYVSSGYLESHPDRLHVDKTSVYAIANVLRISVVITGVLFILQTFGVKISVLLAFGGVGGLAVGFAAKDLLANFFGGLMIYLDRPFSVGEWIRSPEKNIEGTVEQIGWRLTRLRTFDKRPLFVPNGLFSTIPVENASRMQNRRIDTIVGLRYDDAEKMSTVLVDIREMLKNHEGIDKAQRIMVNFVEFGPSSLNIRVYTFTETTEWQKFQDIREDVFFKIIKIISKHGAQCAFPTTTVHLSKEAS